MTTPKRANELSTHPRYDFTYKQKGDALDARPLARRIKRAVDAYKASDDAALRAAAHGLEHAVYALTLVAGNQLATDLPLDIQYLSGMQRVSDWWGNQMIHSPVNCTISLTMTYLSNCVERELELLESALDAGKTVDATAEEIERLLTKGTKSVQHTLRAILVELSNESKTGVDSAGVGGAFYKVAAATVPTIKRRWTRIHTEQALRHIDVLLNNPTAATAKTLIDYWDDHRSKDLKTDPFPAKPDPFKPKRKTRR